MLATVSVKVFVVIPPEPNAVTVHRVSARRMCVSHCNDTRRRADGKRTLKLLLVENIDARRIGRCCRRRDRRVAAKAD